MNHQDSYCQQKRKPARAEEESGKRTRKQLKSTHEDTNSYSDVIETTRISAKPHEDFTNYYEEEEDDSCRSTNGEGRDQQDNSCTTTATTPATPGDDTPGSYAARKTNHTNAGCCDVLESDKLNGQSDESCEPSSNDENKQLRQHSSDIEKHSDIEKRMEANRLRAKATRRKKKVMIEEMRSKIFVLTVENEKLKNQNRVQQTEIEFLRNIQGQQHQQQQQHQYLPTLQMLSQPLPLPLPNPMTTQSNGASIMSCNTSRTKNYAANSALLVAVTAPSDSLPQRLGSIGNANTSSAAPSYLGGMQNQLLFFGGDAKALHHSSSDQQQQNTAGAQAMDLSNSSLAAFLSNACSGGVNASSSQIGLTGEQNDFPPHSFHPHGGVQSFSQQASTFPDDHHQTRRDRLLLQLLMEKHNSNSTDI